jgi:hypothetical protein
MPHSYVVGTGTLVSVPFYGTCTLLKARRRKASYWSKYKINANVGQKSLILSPADRYLQSTIFLNSPVRRLPGC